MAGDFSDDFSDDFDNETSEYQIRVRPVGSSDEDVRQGFKYTSLSNGSVVYSQPVGFIKDVTHTLAEIDLTEATDLAARLKARYENVHHATHESVVI